MKRAIPLVFLLSTACGGEVPPPVSHPSTPPPAAPAAPPPGAVWREDVVKTVNAGLGRFLQHVEVEPKLDGGAFVGFRIISLQPPEFWEGVDLQPGDVVLRINSLPIERDSEAYAAFQNLKSADQLTVLVLREGEQRELRWRILERGAASPKKAGAKSASVPRDSGQAESSRSPASPRGTSAPAR